MKNQDFKIEKYRDSQLDSHLSRIDKDENLFDFDCNLDEITIITPDDIDRFLSTKEEKITCSLCDGKGKFTPFIGTELDCPCILIIKT